MVSSITARVTVILECTRGNVMQMNSLKTKMVLAVSAVVILLLAAMSSIVFIYFEATFKEAIANQEFAMVQRMVREIDDKLDTAQATLIAISETVTPEILGDIDKAQALLDSKVGVKTIYDNHVCFFTPEGTMLAESPFQPDRRGVEFGYRDYIKETVRTKKPYISKPYISTLSHHHPAVMVTAPIFNSDGELIGILGGGLDLMKDNFLGGLPRTRIGETGYVYIYDTDRTMILHPDSQRILQKDVPLGTNQLFDMAIEGYEGTEETVNSLGTRMLASVKHLKKTDWILVANQPLAEVYAPIDRAKPYFLLATILGMLLVVMVIWFVVRTMTNPLERFTKHVEQLHKKRGEERFSGVFSDDEIGALSTAFNKMIGLLDKQTESLEKSTELYRTVTDFASDMAFWRGQDETIFYVSPNCERITGYRDEDFYAQPSLLDEIVHPDDRAKWMAYFRRSYSTTFQTLEFRIITCSNNMRWISCVSRHVFDERNEVCGLRGSHQDITEQKLAQEQLQYISLHDSLTGFYNRASFEAALSPSRPQDSLPVTIFVCDVDGLKFVNDTLGHRSGDELLGKIAKILKRAFTPLDAAIYRIGGDEFVIVVANFRKEDAARRHRRLCDLIEEYNNEDSELPVGMSIGYAVSGENGQVDMVTLFKDADDAMYREKMERSKSVRGTTMQALMKALEARDFRTAGHTDRLQNLVGIFGTRINMDEKSIDDLRRLAQFHDIGKIGIPDNILFKPGPLTAKERTVMQRHPEIGYRIAIATPDLVPIADFIFRHHEWWNGQGYPLQLKGEEIPLQCRLLAIVDAYEAMTSDRPYRKAMSHRQAIDEISRFSGSQFDPQLAEWFVSEFADEPDYLKLAPD